MVISGAALRANIGWSNCRTKAFVEGIPVSRCEPFAPMPASGSSNGFTASRTGRDGFCLGEPTALADCASLAPRGLIPVEALAAMRAERYIFFFKIEVDNLLMLVSRMSFYKIGSSMK